MSDVVDMLKNFVHRYEQQIIVALKNEVKNGNLTFTNKLTRILEHVYNNEVSTQENIHYAQISKNPPYQLSTQNSMIASPPCSLSNLDSVSRGAALAISVSENSSYFKCILNGFPAWLPRDTLRTMAHCLNTSDNKNLILYVENEHIYWMMQHLGHGGLFIDIGAATGAATIPIGLKYGPLVEIIAFEPSNKARKLLKETCLKNGINDIQILEFAVSDTNAQVEFMEFDQDITGEIPFLPETSTIRHDSARSSDYHSYYTSSITLDYFAETLPIIRKNNRPIVVKIDVEGFEEHVLKGALNFINSYAPFFSIDIHNRINGHQGTTEEICRHILNTFNYSFIKTDHVLLCTPQHAN